MIYKKTLREISEHLRSPIVGGKNSGDDAILRIEYDSRTVGKDDIFVALTGHKFDGHKFAQMAYSSGCRAFLCEKDPGLPADAAVIYVNNTREVLPHLSAFFYGYPADKLKIVGITGTKGKTTTSLMLSEILNRSGKNCAYIGSNGVVINGKHTDTVNTTPESRDLHRFFAKMVEGGVTHVAIEVSSQALAHNRVDGIPFAARVFMNLSPDHTGDGEHKDFAEYKAAKASFFTGADSAVIYNADDTESLSVIAGHAPSARVISFGLDRSADFYAVGDTLFRDSTTLGIGFSCHHGGTSADVRLNSPGSFSIYNALAAIACADVLGVSLDTAADALRHTFVCGRFQIVPGLPDRTFIVDYAHNGESLRRALSALREFSPKRLTVVFGSVGARTFIRRRELAEAASALADLSIITSDNPDTEDPTHICAEIESHMDKSRPYMTIIDREEAVRFAVRNSSPGDIVLFAGKGHETYQLVNGKKLPFIESDIIRDECMKMKAEKQHD